MKSASGRSVLVAAGVAAASGFATPTQAVEWKANEVIKTYAVSGTSGAALYESMGENGPTIGDSGRRTIAYTTFDLKWSRKYEPQKDGSCKLASARPSMTITYVLPKPSSKLSGDVKARWAVFYEGIRNHEKVHGDHMKEMVDRILATTVGVSAPEDPKCQKVRKAIQTPLSEASQEQRQRSADFDRDEMSGGGNVHQLILNLINGG